MNAAELSIEQSDMRKLLGAASGDAALLYLYLRSGNDPAGAGQALNMNQSRLACAGATLRQLGLWREQRRQFISGERPVYSEQDVIRAMDDDKTFRSLYGEVQRLLGRNLNTEEMKIILGIIRYLGFEPEMVCVLINYCKARARSRGSLRNPSLRTIEKEAYAWAELGLETMEDVSAYIHAQNKRNSQLGQLMETLGIRGRSLTPSEEKYAQQWLDMGFETDAVAIAYDRTCLNTGGMNWAYMNKILTRWRDAGLFTAEQIQNRDTVPKGGGKLGDQELENIQRLLREG